jgi:hypothetical protein
MIFSSQRCDNVFHVPQTNVIRPPQRYEDMFGHVPPAALHPQAQSAPRQPFVPPTLRGGHAVPVVRFGRGGRGRVHGQWRNQPYPALGFIRATVPPEGVENRRRSDPTNQPQGGIGPRARVAPLPDEFQPGDEAEFDREFFNLNRQ